MNGLNFEGLSDKQLQLFAVRCARRVQYLMTDPRSIKALDVAERYAHGQATDEELLAAQVAAGAAARDAAWTATDAAEVALTAARDAAWAAADSALTAAMTAAWAAAWAAAWDAAMTAADSADSARAAELAEQQKILDEIRKEEQK